MDLDTDFDDFNISKINVHATFNSKDRQEMISLADCQEHDKKHYPRVFRPKNLLFIPIDRDLKAIYNLTVELEGVDDQNKIIELPKHSRWIVRIILSSFSLFEF